MEPLADRIKKLMKELSSTDPKTAFKAERELTHIVEHAADPSKAKERDEVAAVLAAGLNAMTEYKDGDKTRTRLTHSTGSRRHIARCLSFVGGEKEVGALAKAAEDFNLREMARFALDRNPSAAATMALIGALDHVGTDFRVGVVNALAQCGCDKSANALRSVAVDSDVEVRLAAVEALANFANPAHDEIIASAAGAGAPRAKTRVAKARIRLAETLRKAGDQAAATRIYKTIQRANVKPAQKKAAELALNPGRGNGIA